MNYIEQIKQQTDAYHAEQARLAEVERLQEIAKIQKFQQEAQEAIPSLIDEIKADIDRESKLGRTEVNISYDDDSYGYLVADKIIDYFRSELFGATREWKSYGGKNVSQQRECDKFAVIHIWWS